MAGGSTGDQWAALRLHGNKERSGCLALAPVATALAFHGCGFCRDGGCDDRVNLFAGQASVLDQAVSNRHRAIGAIVDHPPPSALSPSQKPSPTPRPPHPTATQS